MGLDFLKPGLLQGDMGGRQVNLVKFSREHLFIDPNVLPLLMK